MKNINVKPIPGGYHALTPFPVAQGAGMLLDFLKRAMGARELSMMRLPCLCLKAASTPTQRQP